ncbi:MAG: hypothetical protein HXX13_03765 [Bacteroidetes bacterium]|nr:hypothetical protein [Bacteroidota bacterium]
MKRNLICSLVAILAFLGAVNAQDNQYQKDLFRRKISQYNGMKNAGIGLTVGGAVLVVVGISTFSNAVAEDPDLVTENAAGKATLGLLCTELGCVAFGGGVVLWAVGGSKKSKYIKKLNALSLNLKPNPYQTLSLAYRF